MLRRPNSALPKRKPCVGKNREWLSRVVAKNVNFAMIKGGNMTDYAEISPIFMLVMLAIIGLVVWRWMRDEGYVRHMLGRFFMAKRIVHLEFDRMRTAAQ